MRAILRVCVGGLFVYSGWSKLIRPVQEFQYAIEQYQVFPALVAKIVSHVLPWTELICGAFLALGFMRLLSARVLSVLCFSFLSLLISAILRKIDLVNCGCFGEGIHLTPIQALTLDSCLLLLLVYFASSPKKVFELDGCLKRNPNES